MSPRFGTRTFLFLFVAVLVACVLGSAVVAGDVGKRSSPSEDATFDVTVRLEIGGEASTVGEYTMTMRADGSDNMLELSAPRVLQSDEQAILARHDDVPPFRKNSIKVRMALHPVGVSDWRIVGRMSAMVPASNESVAAHMFPRAFEHMFHAGVEPGRWRTLLKLNDPDAGAVVWSVKLEPTR